MSQDSQENHEQYQSLLQKMAQGSEAALAEFYCIFESKIFAFANIRLNDSQEASDLLNDVMWEVWRGAGRFEGRSSVTTWVFGIAHHKVIVFELKGSGAFIADLEVCAGQAGVFPFGEMGLVLDAVGAVFLIFCISTFFLAIAHRDLE